MKAVILAGGFGTRLSEETHLRPKPMVEIGVGKIVYPDIGIGMDWKYIIREKCAAITTIND